MISATQNSSSLIRELIRKKFDLPSVINRFDVLKLRGCSLGQVQLQHFDVNHIIVFLCNFNVIEGTLNDGDQEDIMSEASISFCLEMDVFPVLKLDEL